jgi:hypothetical protein
MQRILKVTSIILLVSVLLGSCGGVTPVPIITPTSSPTQTTKPVSTSSAPTHVFSTETITPSPIIDDGPEFPRDSYQVRTLSEDDYDAILRYVNEHRPGFLDSYQNGDKYLAAFSAERWLRSNPSERDNFLWEILNYDPVGIPVSTIRPGQDLASFMIENLLNKQNVQPDQMPEYLTNVLQGDLLSGGLVVADPLNGGSTYIPNLFGDGQNAYIFTVQSTNSIKLAIYSAHLVNGRYQVDKIRDWEQHSFPGMGRYYGLVPVDDINKNGIPELALSIEIGSSGTPQHWSESLWFYEWDRMAEKFNTDTITVFDQDCDIDGPCKGDWKVKSADRSLLASEYFFTLETDYSETPTCSNLEIQRKYGWNGESFSKLGEQILPARPNSTLCEVTWAYSVLSRQSGWRNDRAVRVLSDGILNWPKEMNEIWGRASKDYFQFKLGLWHDFRGEADQALETLETLGQDSPFLTEAANAYLDARSRGSIWAACQKVNEIQRIASREKFPSDLMPAWGFGSDLWIYSIPDLCNEKAALESLLTGDPSMDTASLKMLLRSNHLDWSDIQYVQYPESGIQVWFVVLPRREFWADTGTTDELWLVVNGPSGMHAKQVLSSFRTTTMNESALKVQVLDVPQRDVVATQFGDMFAIHQILPNGDITEISSPSYYYRVNGFQLAPGSSTEIQVWTDQDYVDGQLDVQKIISYIWDDKLEKFRETNGGYDFESARKKAEQLVYQSQDFSSAITFINTILLSAPPENSPATYCFSRECQKSSDWYNPYFRYLLGISYEMTDQPEKARNIYYDLWKDFPENAFGFAAGLKLGPVSQ